MTQLTAHEIRKIVGRLNDDRVAAIRATGATADDALEAFTWLTSGEHHHGQLVKLQFGRIAEVHDILRVDEPDIEVERPR